MLTVVFANGPHIIPPADLVGARSVISSHIAPQSGAWWGSNEARTTYYSWEDSVAVIKQLMIEGPFDVNVRVLGWKGNTTDGVG